MKEEKINRSVTQKQKHLLYRKRWRPGHFKQTNKDKELPTVRKAF